MQKHLVISQSVMDMSQLCPPSSSLLCLAVHSPLILLHISSREWRSQLHFHILEYSTFSSHFLVFLHKEALFLLCTSIKKMYKPNSY